MAHTKAKGTSKLGRDSASQRLGVKKYSGEKVLCGNIIIRQRGTKYYPGENVIIAKDDSIVADAAEQNNLSESNQQAVKFYTLQAFE